ncbi:hypothetical protein SeLEV6574_g00694 [Synchytrium endobioticum]|nr:hypothetical protein SeLEV6574_g00694 [Synchytrium endobioticum]
MPDTVRAGHKITSVKQNGFIVGDFDIAGPIMLLNGSLFMWDVPQFGVGSDEIVESEVEGLECVDDEMSPFHGWDTTCLKLLELVDPRPEILVVGTGAVTYVIPRLLRSYLMELGMHVEYMSTTNAAATYNVLLQEGRRVGAALLPPFPTCARTSQSLVSLSDKAPKNVAALKRE